MTVTRPSSVMNLPKQLAGEVLHVRIQYINGVLKRRESIVAHKGVAHGRQSSREEVFPGVHSTGMSYFFDYTEQNTKHKSGKNTKRAFV